MPDGLAGVALDRRPFLAGMAARVRIVEETPTRLSFDVRASIWGLGAGWLLAALLSVWLGPTYRIRCARTGERAARCHVQRQFLGIPLSDRAVSNVFGATVQVGDVGNSRPPWRCLSNLSLLTSQGIVPATSASLWGQEGQGRVAAALHAFLDAKGSIATEIRLRSSLSNWLICCFGLAWGGLVTLLPAVRCTLDKEQGRIVLVRGRVWRKRTNYWLDHVGRFAIRQQAISRYECDDDPNSPFSEGGPLRNEAFDRELALALCLKTGEEITLATPMSGGQRGLRFVRQLERFRQAPPPGESPTAAPGDWLHNI